MKNLINYFVLISIFALIMMPFFAMGAGPGVHKDKLVGHWTFEKGEELTDLTGNWPDIELKGAKIVNGALDVDSGKWAITVGDYKGPPIKEKTLLSWFSFQDNSIIKGSIVCIDKITEDSFDAIVYAGLGQEAMILSVEIDNEMKFIMGTHEVSLEDVTQLFLRNSGKTEKCFFVAFSEKNVDLEKNVSKLEHFFGSWNIFLF